MALWGLFLGATAASAQTYPSRPIRLVVPLAPASTGDILARVVGERVAKSMGQPVVIDNRPGAGGNIGADLVAKAAPDGHTLLIATIATHGINPSLYKSLPFDATTGFSPVTLLVTAPCVMIVNPSNPSRNVGEFIDWSRAKTIPVTFGSGGNGNAQHLAGELFGQLAGVKVTHVPYKGAAQAVTAVMTGEVDVMFPNIPLAQSLIQAGRLHALGVSASRRLSALPEVAPVGETLRGFEVLPWFGLMGPGGLPRDVVKRLHAEFTSAVAVPAVREALVKQGFEIQTSTPEEFAAFVRTEISKWSAVVKTSGAMVD
jgi:tripartite-type tricarboxylate transporter receptor subunit TctC